MRELEASEITRTVKELCIKANTYLPQDVKTLLRKAAEEETEKLTASILSDIVRNFTTAEQEDVPVCQDTGLACIFLSIGQDVHIKGNLNEAVNEGVRLGYKEGCLRKSVVRDPLERINTNDNTPCLIYTELTDGDKVTVTVMPKGCGSENMGRLAMLKPSDSRQGVIDFVLETVRKAGANPCPPIIVGVGIGGNFDKVALSAKKALLRDTGMRNSNPYYAQLEEELLEKINSLGIGAQGVGGKTTALCVNIEALPTHIGSLPVAVNLNCHVARKMTAVL